MLGFKNITSLEAYNQKIEALRGKSSSSNFSNKKKVGIEY